MLGARTNSIDKTLATTPARPTEVVDVHDWLDRATQPGRPFAPGLCEYVPRHRAEAEGPTER